MPGGDITAGVLQYLLPMIPYPAREADQSILPVQLMDYDLEPCCVIAQAPRRWEGLENEFVQSNDKTKSSRFFLL